jgi:hypothetical protein
LFKNYSIFSSWKVTFSGRFFFSTSVTDNRATYLTGKEDNPNPLPSQRISVRPLFAKSEPQMPLLQVNVELSFINP